MTTAEEEAGLLEVEHQKVPKLQIIFGVWWKHYVPPVEFAYTLYRENDFCPYCAGSLGPFYRPQSEDAPESSMSAHLEHMDPLALGGEDSIRNALYVCASCNLKKRSRPFVVWLAMLPPAQATRARFIYIDKHGHSPEEFKPSQKTERSLDLMRALVFDEAVLKKLFPKPIVSGPPAWA